MSDQIESISSSSISTEQQPDAQRVTASPAIAPSQAASLLMDVKLPIRVVLGRTRLCLRDIVQLGSGAVVELDCRPDDPVEIIVNDRVIAQGEVVVVSGNYGVRVTKIAPGARDRESESQAPDLLSLSDKLR